MLRLLLVALPLVVASPAAFDAQEIDALQIEVQSPAAFDAQEIDALQIEVQFPLQIEVRYPPGSRPLRPSRHARSTRQPCHTLHSASTTPANRTHHKGRAAALECGQDDPPFDLRRHQPHHSPGIPTHHPQVRPPARPAISHVAQLRSALPLRARPSRMLHVHSHEAARARAMSAPAPARLRRLLARRGAMQLALAIGTCERARR